MGPVERTDHVRGLALTCLVLAVAGLCSLVTVTPRHRTRLVSEADRASLTAGIEIGGASGDPSLPPPTVPLFSAAPAPAVAKPTSTTSLISSNGPGGATATEAVHPAVGTFTYNVDGTEGTTGFGTRKLPTTMTLAIQRGGDGFAVDLALGADHKEHEVWSASADLIGLRGENITAVFGPVTRSMAATYDASVGRLSLPLKASTSRAGASAARDASGAALRTEDWTVTDVNAQTVTIGGASVSAWEVTVTRTSRSGATEPLTETRKAWFDPTHGLWLKWQTQLHTDRGVSSYDLNYTATLAKLPN